MKLIGLAQELKVKDVPYSIIVQLATDLRNIDDNTSKKIFEAYKKAQCTFFLSEENISKTEMLFGEELLNKVRINNPFNYHQGYCSIDKGNHNLACVAAYTSFHKSQDLLITV
ncbi:hypothetical protein OAM38_00065 [Flavobacteriaceae bacterium]|nr:hypothetical protein [Flavobacteriaceae bacterium]